MSNKEINSGKYWDNRFIEDWDNKQGDKQSIFFMNLALEIFPAWFKKELAKQSMTICDWGCAEGDGTNLLATNFTNCKVEGIDFAATAVENANKRYNRANLSFISKDILKNKHAKKYDIVLTSNVLEHFHDPWNVFDKVSQYARDYFVMIIPFNEDRQNLMSEHFHGFKSEEFKPKMGIWHIVHFEVVDTSLIPGTYWGGQQAVIIFASEGIFRKLGLTFKELTLTADKTLVIRSLNIQLESYEHSTRRLQEELREQQKLINNFSKAKRYIAANKFADRMNKILPPNSRRRKVVYKLYRLFRTNNYSSEQKIAEKK